MWLNRANCSASFPPFRHLAQNDPTRKRNGQAVETSNPLNGNAVMEEKRSGIVQAQQTEDGCARVKAGRATAFKSEGGITNELMNFTDTQLQACFELKLGDQMNGVPADLREVGALIATHDWFRMLEGAHSSRVHETIERLLSPRLRPGLHGWFRRPDSNRGTAAIEFRDRLNQLAGERLEQAEGPALNPS